MKKKLKRRQFSWSCSTSQILKWKNATKPFLSGNITNFSMVSLLLNRYDQSFFSTNCIQYKGIKSERKVGETLHFQYLFPNKFIKKTSSLKRSFGIWYIWIFAPRLFKRKVNWETRWQNERVGMNENYDDNQKLTFQVSFADKKVQNLLDPIQKSVFESTEPFDKFV